MSSVFLALIRRLHVQIAIFGAVLLIGAIFISYLFSPERFTVQTDDGVKRIGDLVSVRDALVMEKQEMEQERTRVRELTPTPVLHEIHMLRDSQYPVLAGITAVHDAIDTLRIGERNPVTLSSMTYDNGVLMLTGEVWDRSGQSTSLLASLVDRLREITFITQVSEPEYISVSADDGGAYSPFEISLSFAQ